MKASILIISKNRKEELSVTLNRIGTLVDISIYEVLVLLDGCSDGSEELVHQFNWVIWTVLSKSIGASAARHTLYPKAQGEFLIGLDDDAHPLHSDFIEQTVGLFDKYSNVGIIAFQEVKGIYTSDTEALLKCESRQEDYFTNDFIGCGFAMRKEVYKIINGFPVWIDIYGEESCVAIEVIAKGFEILYSNKIKVNHRVNREVRKITGQNYFRFGKQLKNSTYYFLVYYQCPLISIVKLYWHNFRKYALTDYRCFKIFFKIIFEVSINLPRIMKYREPIDKEVIKKMRSLSGLKF
ncbi:glycosyltransferase family 2 protein [Flavobacterium sp. ZS1P70]|uniref:Glycosyltransferase family 2 protein n=1 Tax=Flavobacterium zhoui TaxID=3230414 RepID=A0ABW6I7Y8_9FLAO